MDQTYRPQKRNQPTPDLLPVQTLRVGEKNKRVGKRVPDTCVPFSFGAELTILGATNGVARVKIW